MGKAKGKDQRCLWWGVAAALLQVCLGCGCVGQAYGQSQTDEYRLKAIYLRKLPKFVQWPAQDTVKQSSRTDSTQLCVAGNYSFGVLLGQEAERATELGQKMDIRLLGKELGFRGCDVVFVSRSEWKKYEKILESLKGSNVLTVGETDEFLEAGGIVELNFADGRLQFGVNLAAARAAHLKIDARLLSMAKRVIREKDQAGT
jgi:hypothetical protein